MICTCEKCRFVFESIRLLDSCPDCAGGPVREATDAEKAKYRQNRRMYGPMKLYGGIREVEIPLVEGWSDGRPVYAEHGVRTKVGPNGEILATMNQDGRFVKSIGHLF